MAIGPAVGYQLVCATSGQHLATQAFGVVAQKVAGVATAAPARQAESAVAGVHHKQCVFGGQALGNILQLGHGYGIGGDLVGV